MTVGRWRLEAALKRKWAECLSNGIREPYFLLIWKKSRKKNKPKPKCFIVKDQKYKNQKCFFIVQLLMSPFDKILSFYRPCIFLPK